MPDPITAIIGGGTSIISGMLGSRASEKAAKAQQRGADAATAAQLEMYYQSREDLAPWREAGKTALNQLTSLLKAGPGEFTQSPGYQFRLGEGVKTLERGAAARGRQLGGAQQKALTRFGQDYASGEYQNWLNRYYQKLNPYFSMAGMGQVGAQQTAQAGQQAGQGIANNLLYAGQAQAGQARQQGQIWSDVMGGGADMLLLSKLLK